MLKQLKARKWNNTTVVCIILLIFFIYTIFPSNFATHYPYISKDDLISSLVVNNLPKSNDTQEFCKYQDLVRNNEYFYVSENIEKIHEPEDINAGGEFFPLDCQAVYRTAVIVPYRNRESQLETFLIYMHNYLRRQRIHYRIFVIEQNDSKPFNRAKLFNIGSVIAKRFNYNCMILHDVDLLPMYLGQLYGCTTLPRHMCAGVSDFRYNLLYKELFGGVVSITLDQFNQINGLSNLYEGWGGEDDDFFARLEATKIPICRFAPPFNIYYMLPHKKETPNSNRRNLLVNAVQRHRYEGLNTLNFKEKAVEIKTLFTRVLVDT
ncbi:hypothetical protein ACFFRR_008114 [Megaselia abdita]